MYSHAEHLMYLAILLILRSQMDLRQPLTTCPGHLEEPGAFMILISWIIPATLAPWRQDNDTLRPDTDGVSGVALFEAVLKVGVEDVGL